MISVEQLKWQFLTVYYSIQSETWNGASDDVRALRLSSLQLQDIKAHHRSRTQPHFSFSQVRGLIFPHHIPLLWDDSLLFFLFLEFFPGNNGNVNNFSCSPSYEPNTFRYSPEYRQIILPLIRWVTMLSQRQSGNYSSDVICEKR